MIIKTDAIVIRSTDYGEGNKIITLFTKTHGKISVMARGAKKVKSRMHGTTQMFSYGQYIIYLGKDMGTLNQADLHDYYQDIYYDIEKTAFAAYVVELADKVLEPREPNPYFFEQTLASIQHINKGKDLDIVARIFEMKVFQAAGYKPNLHKCTVCGSEDSFVGFSVYHGGFICDEHEHDIENYIKLQSHTIKLLRIFEQIDLRRLGDINVKPSTKSQLQLVTRSFYDEYINSNLKSRHFLDQMKNFNI